MRVAAALLGLSGCFIVPVTHTDSRTVSTSRDAPVPGSLGKPELVIDLAGSTLVVTARRQRACATAVHVLVETHSHKDADIVGLNPLDANDAWLAIAFGIVELATGAVSGLITSIVVIADGDGTTTQENKLVGRVASACPVPLEGLAIEIVFPSGEVASGTTNAGGVVTTPIPEAAGTGDVVVRAGELETRAWLGPTGPTSRSGP